RAHAVGVRAAPWPAAGAGRTARRAARSDPAATGTGADAGRDRRHHRRGPGNGEIAPALRDGQAARAAGRCRMSTGPMHPGDRDALTPEERALADRLARLGPQGEPSPALDARILAAAREATAAPAPGAP